MFRLVHQHDEQADCAVACLATLLGISYERALLAASKCHDFVLHNGLSTPNILKVAKALGKPLRAVRVGTDDTMTGIGILEVIGDNHVVFFHDGAVVDLRSMTIWSIEDFFAANPKTRPGKLLVRK